MMSLKKEGNDLPRRWEGKSQVQRFTKERLENSSLVAYIFSVKYKTTSLQKERKTGLGKKLEGSGEGLKWLLKETRYGPAQNGICEFVLVLIYTCKFYLVQKLKTVVMIQVEKVLQKEWLKGCIVRIRPNRKRSQARLGGGGVLGTLV